MPTTGYGHEVAKIGARSFTRTRRVKLAVLPVDEAGFFQFTQLPREHAPPQRVEPQRARLEMVEDDALPLAADEVQGGFDRTGSAVAYRRILCVWHFFVRTDIWRGRV